MEAIFSLLKDLSPGAGLIIVLLYLGNQQIAFMRQVQTDNAGFSSKLLSQYSQLDSSIKALDVSLEARNSLHEKQLAATDNLSNLVEGNTRMMQEVLMELRRSNAKV